MGEQTFGSEEIIEVIFFVVSPDGEVSSNVEASDAGYSLGEEYEAEVGSSFDLSDVIVEIKLKGYSEGFERSASGGRVDMVVGLIQFGADAVAVTAAVACNSYLRSIARCSWAYGEER